ncbi:8-amino-7-oxononanoate synthase [Lipingzhangella sp. LS1_29]|uniref:8-amino-7-oxononanoate synthase n=1 Tax=Lipingzhangella rawalii TaxID=2055835 RepID=A0ABU2H6Q4_9ACTN|nr:8-amino-7-oxononanoate synthase [Lipingzhangella rawalii]MDS1270989.1 8-amino-7-oxononanoate synthase [Lipingzhangella rawalii]
MAAQHRSHPFSWLDEAAARRSAAGLTRRLQIRPATEHPPLMDLASNDYLGLSLDPDIAEAAAAAARAWGAGATGSRLVTGSTQLHAELEAELADLYGAESALVFSSGYAANLGMLTALCPRDGLLVCDRNNHASLIDATRLAKAGGAQVQVYAHADPGAADRLLAASNRPALVVSDTVFSVDGDLTDLPALHRTCRERGAGLLLDDAHGIGVLGPAGAGAPAEAGLVSDTGGRRRGCDDVVVSVTLSKALGAQGGAVLGPRRVIEHLVSTARTFIFDTGLAPPATAGALAALRRIRAEPQRPHRARAVARQFAQELARAGFAVQQPTAAVASVRAPSPDTAVVWQQQCRERGVRVGCFRPPSVPDGVSRLRITARADLGDEDVTRALEAITATAPPGARRGADPDHSHTP